MNLKKCSFYCSVRKSRFVPKNVFQCRLDTLMEDIWEIPPMHGWNTLLPTQLTHLEAWNVSQYTHCCCYCY